jgi:hypothetical protein
MPKPFKRYFALNSPWRWFFLAFIASLGSRFIVLYFAYNAGLGWDENLYIKHTNAIIKLFFTGNISEFYRDYFHVYNHIVRFFPPANPIGYAFLSFFNENAVVGARVYNSLMVSLGISSSTAIIWLLTKRLNLTLVFLGLSNLSLTHNAYSLFLWTEGAQFGLVSFIIYLILLGDFHARKCWIIGLLLAWLNMIHGSSLLFSLAIVGFLVFFELTGSVKEKFYTSIKLLLPSLAFIIIWGLITLPVIDEFIMITSETIPMKSLQNPPSSYDKTWISIREISKRDNLSLSQASSQIAWNYIAEKDIHFFFDRGFQRLKEALKADTFPKRHMDHGMWPFFNESTFQFFWRIHHVLYFMVYVGLALYFFQNTGSGISFLLASIFALKIASVFFTGIGMTRYFASFYMIVFPFAFFGVLIAFNKLWKNDYRSRVLQQFAWAIFFATTTI